MRVVIADDHALARAGVRGSLEDGGVEVVAEAVDAAGALEAVREHAPDVALLDVSMPGGGIAAAQAIAEQAPGTAVVMLTATANDDDLFAALRAGVQGYLLKDTDPERLPHALRGVLEGEAAIPRSLVMRLFASFQTAGPGAPNGALLSEREWDVLEGMRAGKPTRTIADELSISEVTVRRHVSAVMRKLQVSDRDAALAAADQLRRPG